MFPGSIGYQELIVIGVVAVILFGGRLPEVARNLGQTYQQFRRGLADLQSTLKTDIDESANKSNSPRLSEYRDPDEEYSEPKAPQFEPPDEDSEDA